MSALNYSVIHPTWRTHFERAINKIDSSYLKHLTENQQWLPGPEKIFNAFSLPLDQVQYVLFGESPYPRTESANGFAFWDAAVKELWSEKGLSKKVNRATSMRNILKMLLVADGKLQQSETTQEAIAQIDKSRYVQTNDAFFQNLISQGFLLLNATLVLQQEQPPQADAKQWLPFIADILQTILQQRPQAKIILFGKIASAIEPLLPTQKPQTLHAEHPYNLSFISNPDVINFFHEMHLLDKR